MEGREKGAIKRYGDGVAWFRGSIIGKGCSGCVYLATLKNPRSKYSCYPSVMAVKSAEVSASVSIQNEREVFSKVKGCADILQCYGEETTTADNGLMVYNLLLEYGSGGTLADRIKQSGGSGLSDIEVRVYTRSILRGLKHVHANGYAHRDLKPDNILLVPYYGGKKGITEFRAKIADFGSAKTATQCRKRRLKPYWRGTPMYLSPEAVLDNVQEAPSDIWALGCIVIQMLTRKPPWNGSTGEILRKIGAEGELPIIPTGISKEARDFLKSCFVRKSAFRFTADMLLNHPFVVGFKDGDPIGVSEKVGNLNEIASSLLVSEIDDEFNGDEWSINLSEEDSCSCGPEEDTDAMEDDIVSKN